jgi:hypothetical protein
VLGDVIPHETGLLNDLKDFLPRGGGLRTVAKRLFDSALLTRSDYPELRRKIGLRRYGDDLAAILLLKGLEGTARPNIGPNKGRTTWIARPSST